MSFAAGALALGGGLLSGGMGLIGSMQQAAAAKKAAALQAEQEQKALQWQQQVYGQGQANLQPFIGAGQNALSVLSGFYGLPTPAGQPNLTPNALAAFNQFTQTPFYTFPLQQGEQAIQQGLARTGGVASGTLPGQFAKYASGYASGNFMNWIDQLSNLAQRGQGAATSLMGGGTQLGQTAADIFKNLGNVQAGGVTGGANELAKALSYIPTMLGLGPGGTGSSYGGGTSPWQQMFPQTFGGQVSGLGGGGGAGMGGGAASPGGYPWATYQ